MILTFLVRQGILLLGNGMFQLLMIELLNTREEILSVLLILHI